MKNTLVCKLLMAEIHLSSVFQVALFQDTVEPDLGAETLHKSDIRKPIEIEARETTLI